MKLVDGLPSFLDCADSLTLRVRGQSAVLSCERFIARISLSSGKLDWVVERAPVLGNTLGDPLPRFISLFGVDGMLWFGDQVVAEIMRTESGGMNVVARDALTGNRLWEQFVAIPEPAAWAESTPAWPGAQTEEIYGFVAKDSERLVVLMARHTRRTRIFSSGATVDTLPPFRCQTDAIRFDAVTGRTLWSATFDDVNVGILQRKSFSGIWSAGSQIGIVDFDSGTNAVLQQYPHVLGWPVHDGAEIAVPWRSGKEVGVAWIDPQGRELRKATWPQAAAKQAWLHRTGAGLALQTSDQGLIWLGRECRPLWSVKAKPYIYQVHCSPETDVFIGTDGNGGRLLAFDAGTGQETLNLKPVQGGVGDLSGIPGQKMLVSTFRTSRSWSKLPRLLVVSMTDRRHTLSEECILLRTWEGGVVCRAGKDGGQIGVIEVNSL